MDIERVSIDGHELTARARVHAALGDPHRLQIVDALWVSDLAPGELVELTGLPSNLLAFHLDVLTESGLVSRRRSQGDGRRRYVTLDRRALGAVRRVVTPPAGPALFVCTHNSARSQLAAGMWRQRGMSAASAGTHPAERVHPLAVEVGAEHGIDLSGQTPSSYLDVPEEPAIVISVCDRAGESELPFDAPHLHWSIPDPAEGTREDFEAVVTMLWEHIDRLDLQAQPTKE